MYYDQTSAFYDHFELFAKGRSYYSILMERVGQGNKNL